MAKWETENPPQKKGRYLITAKTSLGRQVRQADRSEYPEGNWIWCLVPSSGYCSDCEVLAWQKQPEPYKG